MSTRIIPPLDAFPVDSAGLDKFRENWPDETGLPEDLDHLTFWFSEAGELFDVDTYNVRGDRIELANDEWTLNALTHLAELVWQTRETPEKLTNG